MYRMKRSRIVMLLGLFFAGTVVSVYLSSSIHFYLSHQTDTLQLLSLRNMLHSLMSDEQHLKLFGYFVIGVGVLVMLLHYTGDKSYHSKTMKVTPDIETPRAAGQYQHGSARWLTEKEKHDAFSSYPLRLTDPEIKRLALFGKLAHATTKKVQREGDL